MYYFKYGEEELKNITIEPQYLDKNIEGKIHIAFDPKNVLNIGIYDLDDNLIPVKKSSPLRKLIFECLQNKEWDKFIHDSCAIDGIINEDGELVDPIYALFPQNKKSNKINPYQKYNNLLLTQGFPIILNEDAVLFKKRQGENLHLYYRNNFKIIHVCINEFETSIENFECFVKTE
jgi:hypothetical protein